MAGADDKVLREAIARNSAAVLSLPSAGMVRHCKTRLLQDEGGTFLLEYVPTEAPLIHNVLMEHLPVGVSFKNQDSQVIFSTTIGEGVQCKLNDGVEVPALRLVYPAEVKAIQRRANYRVTVSRGEIPVRIWRIAEKVALTDTPHSTAELPAVMRNLSVGGIGAAFMPKDGQPAKLLPDERLRILIKTEQEELLLEGRPRYLKQAPDGSVLAGVQFSTLESDIEGRRAIARLTSMVGRLQREELRRVRLGMMGR